jgi:hypothetical protein
VQEEKLCERTSLFYPFSPFVRGKLFLRNGKFYLRNVTTEIIVEDMIMLSGEPRTGERVAPTGSKPQEQTKSTPAATAKQPGVDADEIPF